MNKNIKIIAKKEYLKIIKKPSFWILIFLVPILYMVLATIAGLSATSVEKKIKEEMSQVSNIIVIDQAGIIDDSLMGNNYHESNNPEAAIDQVKNSEASAVLIYPENILETDEIKIYAQDTSLISRDRFDQIASSLLKQSLLLGINDQQKISLFNSNFKIDKTLYKDGEVVDQRFEVFIVPIFSLVIFFLLVFFSSSFMLSSVAEEKENRMIETVLSIVTSRQLIWGKIIGLVGVAITQLVSLLFLFSMVTLITTNILPITINWSAVQVNPWQILGALYYTFMGFLFLASVMVGVGAVMPSHREAQQFSGIFIMLTVLPIYFATVLIADPSGTIARIISFTPFTAPLILLFRNSFGAISTTESIIGIFTVLFYVIIGFWLAFRLFEVGSLETSKKLSLKVLFKK